MPDDDFFRGEAEGAAKWRPSEIVRITRSSRTTALASETDARNRCSRMTSGICAARRPIAARSRRWRFPNGAISTHSDLQHVESSIGSRPSSSVASRTAGITRVAPTGMRAKLAANRGELSIGSQQSTVRSTRSHGPSHGLLVDRIHRHCVISSLRCASSSALYRLGRSYCDARSDDIVGREQSRVCPIAGAHEPNDGAPTARARPSAGCWQKGIICSRFSRRSIVTGQSDATQPLEKQTCKIHGDSRMLHQDSCSLGP